MKLFNKLTGQLEEVADDQADAAVLASGGNLDFPDEGELERGTRLEQFGSTGQQALGAVETVARTATLGLVKGFGTQEEIAGRQKTLREESPGVSFASQALGAVAPAVLTGGAAGAAAGAAGLGARGAGIATAIGEGLGSGLAEEVEEAGAQGRAVSAGNVLMYGVGGELLGRAIPSLVRKGATGLRAHLGAAADVPDGILAGAERKALESSADVADGLPLGPDRDDFLVNTEKNITDTGATRMAASLDNLTKDFREVTGLKVKPEKLRGLVAKTNSAQRDWAADTSQAALDLRASVRPGLGKAGPELPGAPPKVDYGSVPGLGKVSRDLDTILARGSKELDEASEALDWFQASDRLKQDLARQEGKLAKLSKNPNNAFAGETEELLGLVKGYRQRVRVDLEREDLWGQAGKYQRGINSAQHDNWIPGSQTVDTALGRGKGVDFETGHKVFRNDPAKIRSYLQQDQVGRGLTPEFLEKKLAGAEQAIATHRQFGTVSSGQLSRMEKTVASIREQVRLSDDVQAAKGRAKTKEGLASEKAKFDKEQAGAARETQRQAERKADQSAQRGDMLSGALGVGAALLGESVGLGAVVAVGSKLLRMNKLLGNLGKAGEATVGTAAKGAIRGSGARALRAVERAAEVAPGFTVPIATTAIARFMGEYPTPQTAFDARRRALQAVKTDPMLLHRAIAGSLGSMAKSNPQLYGDLSARLQTIAAYLHQNMPTQLSASMVRPNGIPLSRTTMRDFALKWNSATNPSSVFEDVRDGLASPTQIRTLEAVHPDLYEDLKMRMMREMAESPETMTPQRKVRLDILFNGDGVGGRAYAWNLAKAIKARRAERAQGSGKSASIGSSSSLSSGANSARGTSAIAGSVTNAA